MGGAGIANLWRVSKELTYIVDLFTSVGKSKGNSFFLYANGSFFYAGFGWVLLFMLRVFFYADGFYFYAEGFYFYAEGFYFYAEGFYFYANECNCRGALLENVIVAGL